MKRESERESFEQPNAVARVWCGKAVHSRASIKIRFRLIRCSLSSLNLVGALYALVLVVQLMGQGERDIDLRMSIIKARWISVICHSLLDSLQQHLRKNREEWDAPRSQRRTVKA